jgi:hypothetical protein
VSPYTSSPYLLSEPDGMGHMEPANRPFGPN